MRTGRGEEVCIVTSGEFRSLFAANNIAQAVRSHERSGATLAGLVANLRGLDGELSRVERLAYAIGSRVLGAIVARCGGGRGGAPAVPGDRSFVRGSGRPR